MQRFNKITLTGLIAIVLFLLISYLVISGMTRSIDNSYSLLLNRYAGGYLNSFLVYSSLYGREYFWIPVTAIMLLFGREKTRFLAVELAGIFIAAIIVGLALHHIYFRERPFEALSAIVARVPPDFGSSFPSGHALIVSVGASFAVMKFRNKALSAILSAEAAVVCYSRVYVGMHYPTDVIAGIFLGIALAAFGSIAIELWLYGIADKLTYVISKALEALRIPELLDLT
ncbi:MAG: phosphatase PAP2 family protein [Conexivisphaerales archaeon]